MKRKGFTLIELLAVIVILAIIALIATPIVLNIIENTKDEANKRSVDMYVRGVKNSIAKYHLEYTKAPKEGNYTTEDGKTLIHETDPNVELTVDYDGNVVCDTIILDENGNIYLADCMVNDVEVDYSYDNIKKVCTIEQQDENIYSVGDIITCELSKSTDKFYVIEETPKSSQTIKALTEKIINPTTYRQSDHSEETYVSFSTTVYWKDYEITYPADVYDDNNDIVKPIVDAYVLYLNDSLTEDATGNLLTKQQVDSFDCSQTEYSCNKDWLYNSIDTYWVSYVSDNTGNVWTVHAHGRINAYSGISYFSDVRPVITISTYDIKQN